MPMKIWFLLTTLPFLLFGFMQGDGSLPGNGPLRLGSVIPKANVKLENCGGAWVNLRDAGREKGLLVIFSCNTCPTVVANHKRITNIGEYAVRNKIGMVVLNSNEANRDGSDSKQAMMTYALQLGYKWVYLIDKNSQIADAFGATHTPEAFLFNKLGKLVYHGAIDDSPHDENNIAINYLSDAIRQTAEGKDVKIKETEIGGCLIRRK